MRCDWVKTGRGRETEEPKNTTKEELLESNSKGLTTSLSMNGQQFSQKLLEKRISPKKIREEDSWRGCSSDWIRGRHLLYWH